ncbi:hypothetical protein EJB05_26008, partial [Eragrostis curvula]
MDNPVVIVEKIIQIAFAIKEAVETVRDNKEDCLEVEQRVLRISGLLSLLKGSSETMMRHHAMSGALEDLEAAVRRALEAVTACQGRNVLFLFCAAGKNAKRLRRVQDVISHRTMVAMFACTVAVFVATEGLHSAQPSLFGPAHDPVSDEQHRPSPPTPTTVQPRPPAPRPTSHQAVAADETLHSRPPAHRPDPPPRPTRAPPLDTNIAPAFPKHVSPQSPPVTSTAPSVSKGEPPRPPTQPSPPPPPPPPSATFFGPPLPKEVSPRPHIQPSSSPPPPPPHASPPLPKHLPHRPPTHLTPSEQQVPSTPTANKAPLLHGHPPPLPPHSSTQSTKGFPVPASGSSPHLSTKDVSFRIHSMNQSRSPNCSGKVEVNNEGKSLPLRSETSSPFLPGKIVIVLLSFLFINASVYALVVRQISCLVKVGGRPKKGLAKFSLSELKAATQKFAEKHKIGSKDFCTVYKGIFHGGLMVAIKDYQGPPEALVAQICAELLLASHIQSVEEEDVMLGSSDTKLFWTNGTGKGENFHSKRSNNIIRIIGYGHEFIWKHKRFEPHIFLVEEYMQNGDMGNTIYGSQFDWSSRFMVIRGVAQGLHYLHQQNIVHMNMKPTNVLLDSDMNPKIADFGISRRLDKSTIHDNNIAGTVGYMPPEYILEGTLSTKYDVYSFGVILLETINGMCRAQKAPHQASIQWAWKVRGCHRMEELFDQSLRDKSQIMEINKCLEIGLLCTQFMPEERPTMADILEMLNGKKELPIPNQPEYTKERDTSIKSARPKCLYPFKAEEPFPLGVLKLKGRMVDPLGSVEKIIKVGLAIKDAVKKVRKNKEECRDIRNRVLRVSALLKQLQETVMIEDPAMHEALEALEETLTHTLELVLACQKKNIMCHFCSAGDLSKQLREMKHDISDQLMDGIFAANVNATIILTNIQYSVCHLPSKDAGVVQMSHSSHLNDYASDRSEVMNDKKNNVPAVSKSPSAPLCLTKFTFSELEAATNEFSNENLICRSGFGSVYKCAFQGSGLDWCSRFRIIQGIAQGLYYLHEQHVVHSDMKPSNILLDFDMNPKISDFGIARMLDYGTDLTTRDINYLAGTMGYMPPEYITEGILSTKYDVYSFGVILLETINSMGGFEPVRCQASVEWAWEMQRVGAMKDLFVQFLCDESELKQITRCMSVGLLCTQFKPADRPTIADALDMLNGKKEVPIPKKPRYTKRRALPGSEQVRSFALSVPKEVRL